MLQTVTQCGHEPHPPLNCPSSGAIAPPRLLFTPDTKVTVQKIGSKAFVHFLPSWSYGELVSAFGVSFQLNWREKDSGLNSEILVFMVRIEIFLGREQTIA